MYTEDNSFIDDISLEKILSIILENKISLLVSALLSLILSIIFALSIPNIYTSSAILAPTSQDDSLSSKLGSYSSVVSLAGVTLPDETASKSQEALERIKSFEFFSKHFLPNIKLENIVATKKWVPKTNTVIYDESIFNHETNKWVRKVSFPKNEIPSDQEAFIYYMEALRLSVDKKTSFVYLSIDHISPYIAKDWLEIIISEINESMRKKDVQQAENSIAYLNEIAGSTNIQSLKDAISNLLEGQMQILMLAASNNAYVLEIIDSPIVPEEKSYPKRILIIILGTFMGIFLTFFVFFIRGYLLR